MDQVLEKRLAKFAASGGSRSLSESFIGLEKESLRVRSDGKISQRPHPLALGAALTHPYITTDYSEALLELITPPLPGIEPTLEFLDSTHQYVYSVLDDEIIWGTSMPCIVTGAESIPIAYYGSSNPGRMKSIYRMGLAYRYGKMMQVIAGIHYNFSFSAHFWEVFRDIEQYRGDPRGFSDDLYFAMIRNIQRYGWIIAYLFGASPAVCRSFINGPAVGLEEYDPYTYYLPYATSLRLGDIGYQNDKEGKTGVKANYDNLSTYIQSLKSATERPYPEYQAIGVKVNGDYRQLNANLLQIENEYYSTVRPKQPTAREEKPTIALARRGVQYVELRSLDINVFEPLGLNHVQMRFLETFALFCLLQSSPLITPAERKDINFNQSSTAHRGREPGLTLQHHGQLRNLCEWGVQLCDHMRDISTLLDHGHGGDHYQAALTAQRQVMQDSNLTPSAKILAEMRDRGESFHGFSMRYAKKHQRYFNERPLSEEKRQFFSQLAQKSLQDQQELEAQHQIPLDQYLENYFKQT